MDEFILCIKKFINSIKECLIKTPINSSHDDNSDDVSKIMNELEKIDEDIEIEFSQIGHIYINHVISTKNFGGIDVQKNLRRIGAGQKKKKN
ncbi:hypothetical protein SAMN06296386_1129 [Lachnospiraceae bacterium]|nr:hypothetical protein SAMN06296386_1129 [Lachnospiraceae bacterium]